MRTSILTQKEKIGGRMAYELDEGLPHGLTDNRMRSRDVGYREKRKENSNPDDLQRLQDHIFPSESRQSFVPQRSQKLLDV